MGLEKGREEICLEEVYSWWTIVEIGCPESGGSWDPGRGAFLSLCVLCFSFHSKRRAQLKCLGKITLAEGTELCECEI